jgi:hypothetical protein
MFILKCECSGNMEESFDNLDIEEHTLTKSDQKVIFRLSYLWIELWSFGFSCSSNTRRSHAR